MVYERGKARYLRRCAETFNSEMLPRFLKPGEHQQIFRDARGIAFPSARSTEFHGAYQLNPSDDVDKLGELLRSVYRFGASVPQGLHHDAQFEYGRNFDQVEFECSKEGAIKVTGSHANIYPNDYVRASQG